MIEGGNITACVRGIEDQVLGEKVLWAGKGESPDAADAARFDLRGMSGKGNRFRQPDRCIHLSNADHFKSSLRAVSYSFEPHIEGLLSSSECIGTNAESLRSFALIDAAPLGTKRRQTSTLLPHAPSMLLYENTTAHAALHLSPVLIALDRSTAACTAQLRTLDGACQHLPAMAVLRTTAQPKELLAHLRALLQIEVDDKPFLLRFADTQMLKAANQAFTPAQRAWFFSETDAWLSVDHRGQLIDAVDDQTMQQESPALETTLKLDNAQLASLMEGVAAPVLAAQIVIRCPSSVNVSVTRSKSLFPKRAFVKRTTLH